MTHVVPLGGKKCLYIVSLDALPCPFLVGVVHDGGGEAIYR
jgi:hypothetical protein